MCKARCEHRISGVPRPLVWRSHVTHRRADRRRIPLKVRQRANRPVRRVQQPSIAERKRADVTRRRLGAGRRTAVLVTLACAGVLLVCAGQASALGQLSYDGCISVDGSGGVCAASGSPTLAGSSSSRSAPTARARMRRRTTPARSPSSTARRPASWRTPDASPMTAPAVPVPMLRARRCPAPYRWSSARTAARCTSGGTRRTRSCPSTAQPTDSSPMRAASRTSRPAACAPTPPGPWAGSTTSR